MPRTTRAEEIALGKRIQDGDKEAVAEIVMRNEGIARKLATRFESDQLDYWDFVQEGRLAMTLAAQRWDPSQGSRYGTFAWRYAAGMIRHLHETKGLLVGRQVNNRRNGIPDPIIERMDAHQPAERARQYEDPEALARLTAVDHRALLGLLVSRAGLDKRELRVLYGRFWRSRTLADIGAAIGVSRELVRQIERGALKKLRLALAGPRRARRRTSKPRSSGLGRGERIDPGVLA